MLINYAKGELIEIAYIPVLDRSGGTPAISQCTPWPSNYKRSEKLNWTRGEPFSGVFLVKKSAYPTLLHSYRNKFTNPSAINGADCRVRSFLSVFTIIWGHFIFLRRYRPVRSFVPSHYYSNITTLAERCVHHTCFVRGISCAKISNLHSAIFKGQVLTVMYRSSRLSAFCLHFTLTWRISRGKLPSPFL